MAKTAENTLIQYESNKTVVAEALTDSGDNQTFTGSADVWSKDAGYEPDIRPDGIISGMNLFSPHDDDDKLSYNAFTAYVGGTLVTVAAGTVSITRASTDTHIINSILCDSSGTITAVQGAEGTSFITTRGGNGGPAYVPVDRIELCQVSTSAQAAAAITTAEISQNAADGTQERYDYPMQYDPNCTGDGNGAELSAKENAYVAFASALPTIHTGDVTKKVYATVYEPDFADLNETLDWKPAEETPSTSSKQKYRITTASASKSLGTAGFKVFWNDPATHPLRKLDGHVLTFRTYADVNQAPYCLTQGLIGFATTNPVNDDMGADVTVAATQKSVYFDS